MNMDRNLLDRYKNRMCTEEELNWLKRYFEQDDISAIDALLMEQWVHLSKQNPEVDKNLKGEIWEKINMQIDRPQMNTINRYQRWWSVAASILLILSTGTLLWWNLRGLSESYVEVTNHNKFPKELVMDDGTLVWLTPGSQLIYPNKFIAETRGVKLIGEARFEVKRNTEQPFIVQTESVFTRVLGTTFNIEAFPNRDHIEIALLEGKVAVDIQEEGQSKTEVANLSPGEAFLYKKSNGVYSKMQLGNTAIYKWNEGLIQFHRANIHEVIESLENWYNISISMEDSSRTYESLVHRIDTKKMNLEEVLEGIGLVANYQFRKIENDEYLVISK